MRVDIYLAASLEGFIADAKGGTDWVADDELFEKTAREYGCICMGRTTYDEYGGPAFDGVQHIVLTKRLPRKTKYDNVHFAATPQEAMTLATQLGFNKLLVIGGARTNQAFMQAEVVQKVYADIHPILLGKGIPMFGDYQAKFDFNMQGNDWHNEGFMHAEYTIGEALPAVVVVIIRDQNGAYFVHRRRKDKTVFPGLWGLGAGGKMSEVESPSHAAKRELYEETGLKKAVTPCFEFDYKDDHVHHTVHVFEVVVKKRKDYKNDREWDKTDWLTAEEVNDLMEADQLCPDTAELYQKYRQKMQ